jgi:hypothetical protein
MRWTTQASPERNSGRATRLHGSAMAKRGGSPEWVLTKGYSERRRSPEGGATAMLQLLSPAMARGSSKGQNRLGLHQTGAAQSRQARQAVTVAQNIIEWQCYAWERRLGFSSVFSKVPHKGSPIYRGFAPRSCITRIQPRICL